MEESECLLDKPILIAFVGKSASGKDYWLTQLADDKKFKYSIEFLPTYTTRAPRTDEVQGLNYYFVNQKEFINERQQGNLLEETYHNGWYYGHQIPQTNADFVAGVFSPCGLQSILDRHRGVFSDVIVIYLETTSALRFGRMIHREKKFRWEYVRRLWSDFLTFRHFRSFLNRHGCWYVILENDTVVNQNPEYFLRTIRRTCEHVLERRIRFNTMNGGHTTMLGRFKQSEY